MASTFNHEVIEMEEIHDVIIIGAGPAGLTASIYAKRRMLKMLVITMDIGGQVVLTENIENYLGYVERSGSQLAVIFEQQARKCGTEILMGEVKKVEKHEEIFRIKSTVGEFLSKTVIVTGGRAPRSLGVPGEEKLLGKGVNNSLICNPDVVLNKNIAIIGGGNTALQRAEVLSKSAAKVYLIHRREQFRSDEVTVESVKKCKNVYFVLNRVVVEIRGKDKLEELLVKNVMTGEAEALKVDFLFLDIGRDIKLDYIKDLVETNESGKIVVDIACRTSCKGIFAAGDVTNVPYAQAIIAAGQGATAILSAYVYLVKDKEQKILY
jgi:thioredoxin reductase (NADPH)